MKTVIKNCNYLSTNLSLAPKTGIHQGLTVRKRKTT